MKLTNQQIKQIDNYLINLKVKFVDVRLELIDHLASDFEQSSNYALLEDYLDVKVTFIKNFEKQRQKTIHWSYQAQLRKRLAMFFYKPKYVLFTISLGLIMVFLINLEVYLEASIFLFLLMTCFHISAYITHLKHRKTLKKLQAAQPLYSIMALPSLFLYCFSLVKDYIFENPYMFFLYFFLGTLSNVAGYFEVYDNKSKIIKHSKLIL
ncbi:hypothetical protein [Olleya sp. YS]|uniref:hypothetical protein n=1 Tax=Olleya sp. YS TaxID=3028318 RepID=UPI0024345CB1|nr:hypothetical protein [Olleya sp. YS]WGD35747.1 hypothetical protein Ollyesu_04875 [Olleya sp. YS]